MLARPVRADDRRPSFVVIARSVRPLGAFPMRHPAVLSEISTSMRCRQVLGLIDAPGIFPGHDYLRSHTSHSAAGGTPQRLFDGTSRACSGSRERPYTHRRGPPGMLCSLLPPRTESGRARIDARAHGLLFSRRSSLACQEFSSYQCRGHAARAGLHRSVPLAPSRFVRPEPFGAHDPPSRLSLFMLRWEWFRIYFESGLA